VNSGTFPSKFSLAAFAVWMAVVGLIFGALGFYGSTPGAISAPPAQWPQETALERSTATATLLVFLHPHCPCSRATLENLRTVVDGPALAVILVSIGDQSLASEDSTHFASCRMQMESWKQRSNVSLVHDTQGEETRRFQAATSGHCLLFDADGNLTFSGGVTSSRGHRGACAGLASLTAAVNGQPGDASYPVFGCPLFTHPFDHAKEDHDPVSRHLMPACCKGPCRG